MGEGELPKGIDLFSGPGGLSLGLTLSGFDIVGAVEWDSDAGATYRHNMGDHVHVGDIKIIHQRDGETTQGQGFNSTKEGDCFGKWGTTVSRFFINGAIKDCQPCRNWRMGRIGF